MNADTAIIRFTRGAGGGSLVFTLGKDIFPIYVPRNQDHADWDLHETIYPELAEILVHLSCEQETFSYIHNFYNKQVDRYIVLHHACSRCGERFVQTLHLEENNRRERLKYSFTFYLTPKFVREYRMALKELHAYLTSEIVDEDPRPTYFHTMVRSIPCEATALPKPLPPPTTSFLRQALLEKNARRIQEEEEEETLEFEASSYEEEEDADAQSFPSIEFLEEEDFEVISPFSDE